MPKACSGCQAENVVQAADCSACGRTFGPPEAGRRNWGVIALVAVVAVVAWFVFSGSSGADDEVMENVAKEACEKAVENTGVTGDFVHRVTEDGDDWNIATTVNTRSGRVLYACTAVRDGEKVRARVQPL